MTIRLEFPDYPLFPYERDLAMREVAAFGGTVLKEEDRSLVINGDPSPDRLHRLTFIREIQFPGGRVVTPAAAQFEATSRSLRGRTEKRQQTRYHLHGIHEYKGKFNPQIVRAFANLVSLEPGEWLVDPFCGSGTALLEGLSMGANVLGIDRSPIATLISRSKVRAFCTADPRRLASVLRQWSEATSGQISRAQTSGQLDPAGLERLDEDSIAYLQRWFPEDSLAGLSAALANAARLSGTARMLALVAISSLCRTVSYQRPEDLRIRRRPPGFVPPELAPLFDQAIETVAVGLDELEEYRPDRGGRALVQLSSASSPSVFSRIRNGSRRVVISSPPYATALPYIDTDRLSLALLGLAPASSLGALEKDLIGSREWETTVARDWDQALLENHSELPEAIVALCLELKAAHAEGGFRRRAVASLLYRYFTEMRAALRALRSSLRPGEPAIFVVGSNQTRTPSGPVMIPTPEFLALVSEQAGFVVTEVLTLETFRRFGLHHANSINSESAVVLEARPLT